ncbi:haloacid dehalogenase type II [Natrinema halophilum]|uniref:haloacid dehalogenase type II n=1 Tax=Natrinema halophilum TaxID=1699371 RepID=UPI001F37CCD1|nr:haloacid dehalogenase type II [Natrinema halophilum]UHQ96367.1 haloacid dehalogenase type II [Natrinema halophilum]
MTVDSGRVDTVMFDSFSTIVDVDVSSVLAEYVEDPELTSQLWRTQISRFRPLANFIGYVPHEEINKQALRYVFEMLDVPYTDEDLDQIGSIYHRLDPFDDVRAGMERLSDMGYDLYILSNGDHDVLDSMVENAEIDHVLTDVISADEIKTYKPHSRLYKYAARRTGEYPENIVHCSAAWYDVQGAMHAGMQGIWVNRKDQPQGLRPFDGEIDSEVRDFDEIADILSAK